MLAAYPFDRPVFILPPWPEIYTVDTERDQSFQDAVNVYEKVVKWYSHCAYAWRLGREVRDFRDPGCILHGERSGRERDCRQPRSASRKSHGVVEHAAGDQPETP